MRSVGGQERVLLAQLLGQGGLGGVGMDDRDAVNASVVLQQVDTTPVRQGRNQQPSQVFELRRGVQ
jgi:hypothetical protein